MVILILKTIFPVILLYSFPSFFFWLVEMIKKDVYGKAYKGTKRENKADLNPQLTLKETLALHKAFAFRESDYKKTLIWVQLALIVLLVGLSLLQVGYLIVITFAIVLSYVNLFLISNLVSKQYTARTGAISKILALKRSKMGFIDPQSNVYRYTEELSVEEWNKDNVPSKIVIHVPVTFPIDSRVAFLNTLSEQATFKGYWREDDNGWDIDKGTVTLRNEAFLTPEQVDFMRAFLDFKSKKMGLANTRSSLYTYYLEVDDIVWDDEQLPIEMTIKIPVGFDSNQRFTFLDQMSTSFGRGRPWEVDESTNSIRWNDNKRLARLALQPALPDIAIWHEKYIKNNIVQWSFFPLGIGSRGGVPFTDPEVGEVVRLVGFDVNGAQGKYMKKNGIPVGSDLLPAPHVLGAGVTGGGKSVVQRNILLGCLLRPEKWLLVIIDMKKVEGAMWRKYGVPVATTYKEAAMWLSFSQLRMMERFELMESLGVNNWANVPREYSGDGEDSKAIMINVDEVSELLAPITGKSDEDKKNADYQAICQSAMESIARLGRAAQVHMTTFGQRPSSDVVSMQIRQNAPVRIACGSLPATISQMVFEGGFGATVPANPQGRIGIRIHSVPPFKAQGFFAEEDWLDNYLERNKLPQNIMGSTKMIQDFEQKRAELDEEEDFGYETASFSEDDLFNLHDSLREI